MRRGDETFFFFMHTHEQNMIYRSDAICRTNICFSVVVVVVGALQSMRVVDLFLSLMTLKFAFCEKKNGYQLYMCE